MPRLHPGGLLGVDNVLKSGQVVDPDNDAAVAVARLNDRMADDVGVESVLLPLSDGLTLARRK